MDGNAAFLLVIGKKFSETIKVLAKAKPAARRGRKAKGLKDEAGLLKKKGNADFFRWLLGKGSGHRHGRAHQRLAVLSRWEKKNGKLRSGARHGRP